MRIEIEIADEPVITGRSGVSSKNGQPYTIPDKQRAYIHQGDAYPLPTEVPIPTGSSPYKPGRYLLGGRVFRPGQYGLQFEDREIVLFPVDGEAKSPATPTKG